MVRRDPRQYPYVLTPEDLDVLYLLVDHLTNREIGEHLGEREDTVKWHVTCLLRFARDRWTSLGFRRRDDLAEHYDQIVEAAREDGVVWTRRKRRRAAPARNRVR